MLSHMPSHTKSLSHAITATPGILLLLKCLLMMAMLSFSDHIITQLDCPKTALFTLNTKF